MKVWTVSSRDSAPDVVNDDFYVEGSYTTKKLAVQKAVEYIFNRIEFRDGFAKAMANDENNPEVRGFFSVRSSDGETVVRNGYVGRLKQYLAQRINRAGTYKISHGGETYDFDVDENELEGEVWRTVTFGDSDCEDPQFTTPWPEAFSTKEAALKEFIGYVRDLFRQNGMRLTKKAEAFIRKQIDEDGKVQVDLNDGCCVCLVLNHDDAKNVKG